MNEVYSNKTATLLGYLGASRAGLTTVGVAIQRDDGTFLLPRTTVGVVERGNGLYAYDWTAPSLVGLTSNTFLVEFDDGQVDPVTGLPLPSSRTACEEVLVLVPGLRSPIGRVDMTVSTANVTPEVREAVVRIQAFDLAGGPIELLDEYEAEAAILNQIGEGVWKLSPKFRLSVDVPGAIEFVLTAPIALNPEDVTEQSVQVELTLPGWQTLLTPKFFFESKKHADDLVIQPVSGDIQFTRRDIHVVLRMKAIDQFGRAMANAHVDLRSNNLAWQMPRLAQYTDENGDMIVRVPIPTDRSSTTITALSGQAVGQWNCAQAALM